MKIKIKKTKDRWTAENIEVSRGTVCVWTAPNDSDLYFQFPEGLFSGSWASTKKLKKGNSLEKKATGRRGCYQYAVFLEKYKAFAMGGSPPTIIIK